MVGPLVRFSKPYGDFVPMKGDDSMTSSNPVYSYTAGVSYETEPMDLTKVKFFEERASAGINTYCKSFDHKYKTIEMPNLVLDIQDYLGPTSQYQMFSDSSFIIKTEATLVYVHKNVLTVYGDKEKADAFFDLFGEKNNKCNVYWYYRNRGMLDYHKFPMRYDLKVYDQHYPFIECGYEQYMKRYMDATSSILILLGEPGTGKTSFLKEMIRRYKLNAVVTYDEKLMESDDFYIDFTKDEDRDILIIEDADLLLTSRESDANKAMARLLNMSDGLVNLVKKKVIFTTNLSEINKVDEAIIRPGRCFDVMNFRKLNQKEIQTVCHLHNLPMLEAKEATLSEVFNRDERHFQKSKMGF
jgi:Ni2+-binding GTPase involved in maturation of urease and hydrogenase